MMHPLKIRKLVLAVWLTSVAVWVVTAQLVTDEDTDNFVGHSVTWLLTGAAIAAALAPPSLWERNDETVAVTLLRLFTGVALLAVVLDQIADVLVPMLQQRPIVGTWAASAFIATLLAIPAAVAVGCLLLYRSAHKLGAPN